MELFTLNDFKVFDLDGFSERMAAIATRIRPKLSSIGRELEPKISELVDVPLYVHVAKHVRRFQSLAPLFQLHDARVVA